MQKTKIEWCDYTWNPVVGCKRGCSYCYAKRIWDRFNPDLEFNVIRYYPERFEDKMPKKPSRIFVGSMSDFEYWSLEALESIWRVCESNPLHTFMFLSKGWPKFMPLHRWPKNSMQGLTSTEPNKDREKIEAMEDYPRPFLSIEPMFGGIDFRIPEFIGLVIVGAQTGPGANGPADWMINTVLKNVPEEKLFWKDTLKSRAAKLKIATSTTPNNRQGVNALGLFDVESGTAPVRQRD